MGTSMLFLCYGTYLLVLLQNALVIESRSCDIAAYWQEATLPKVKIITTMTFYVVNNF